MASPTLPELLDGLLQLLKNELDVVNHVFISVLLGLKKGNSLKQLSANHLGSVVLGVLSLLEEVLRVGRIGKGDESTSAKTAIPILSKHPDRRRKRINK